MNGLDQHSSPSSSSPPSVEGEQSNKKGSRPGSRQRRARLLNVNQKEWSQEEESEAKLLIKEIRQAGLTPNDLFNQGVRMDLIKACCEQMGIETNFASSSSSSSSNISTSLKHKRKRRKGITRDKAVAALPRAGEVANETEVTSLMDTNDDGKMESLLLQKIELERERAILARLEKEKGSGEKESIDAVQAMRQAALASMKRKRVSNNNTIEEPERTITFELPQRPEVDPPPLDAPRGPRNRYRDIDAPSDLDAIQRSDPIASEADAAADEEDFWTMEDVYGDAHPDPRSVSRAKPLAYIDDEYRYEIAPAGQVDYSAPLPSLQSAAISRSSDRDIGKSNDNNQQKIEKKYLHSNEQYNKAPPIQRRSTFLPSVPYQRVLVDVSDSEGESDDNQEFKGLRRKTAQSILNLYKSLTKDNTPPTSTQSPNIQTQAEAQSLLQMKEKEIELLKEKMKALEERKKANLVVKSTPANVSDNEHQQQQREETSLSSFSAYESPFTRHPGLRAILQKQNVTQSNSS